MARAHFLGAPSFVMPTAVPQFRLRLVQRNLQAPPFKRGLADIPEALQTARVTSRTGTGQGQTNTSYGGSL
eukprot:5522939-Pyramimonas_sp.AAC.2